MSNARKEAARRALDRAIRADRRKNPQGWTGDIVKGTGTGKKKRKTKFLGAGGISMTPKEREEARKIIDEMGQ